MRPESISLKMYALASLKCKVIQFQERKLEISTAAVFKVTEIAFSSSSLAAAEAGLKRLRLKSLKKVSLRFNFTFYCKMFEFFIKNCYETYNTRQF